MSKEMKRAARPQDHISLSGAQKRRRAGRRHQRANSVNNQTSSREPQKCVGVTTSKPFSMMTGLQSRLLAMTHTHTHTHTHTRTHTHACTHARTHARTHTHTHIKAKQSKRLELEALTYELVCNSRFDGSLIKKVHLHCHLHFH